MGKHHNTLGIAITATPDEIKKAYRKLCMVHHPDKGGNADTFLRIQEAYDSLTINPLTEPPIFNYANDYPIYNSQAHCYANYRNKNGDIDLHFILNDMLHAKIKQEGYLHLYWNVANRKNYIITIPKYFLIDNKYTFTIVFEGMGSGIILEYNFNWPDPRSKWEKFWDAVKKQF